MVVFHCIIGQAWKHLVQDYNLKSLNVAKRYILYLSRKGPMQGTLTEGDGL